MITYGFARRLYLLLLLIPALFALFPFVYMVITSLQQTYELGLVVDFSSLNFNNFTTIFKNYDFVRYFANSAIVVILACVVNSLVSSLAAFGFAKKNFAGKNSIFWIYLATLMIPSQVILVPMFVIIRELNIANTYLALFLPIINAFGVFLVRQFMENVPDELLEAARIDGSGELRVFFTIVIPLVKPVLVSLTVFTFITTWNDFVWPLISITNQKMSTLTLALSSLQGNYATNYGLVMAGATLTFLPPFILYLFLQRQFVEGIALSGIKG
ncbi:carbohydrate ABC transporter permease [Paenibacillus dakarensis]|uniref:carbohydrate ABC transporter permease n=1 Tax=Paenibacillus dakarensis TaxID=1527293 RepID=UPI0006D57B9F|nr:carbohydrate ABC transporter permease [Paenibacillus dakarensis]